MDSGRILDAAGALFAERGVDAVEMQDIARAAGCSRATLYRCFENRAALHGAFVHREARAVASRLSERTAGITDPGQKLLTGLTESLHSVRESPALSAWFRNTSAGAEAAGSSAAIHALTAAFIRSLGPAEPEQADRRARWLVRVVTSLLISPGRDAEEERVMLEEFVLPVVLPAGGSVTPVRAEKLHDETWAWTLWRTDDDRLLLDVVCGSVGIYERSVLLTSEEAQRWERSGPAGLEPLVEEIRNDVTGTRFGERYLR